MGLHLPPNATFSGLPAREVMDFLRWVTSGKTVEFSMAGCLDPVAFDCLDVCIDHGLVEAHPEEIRYWLTPAGEEMRHVKLRNRLPLSQATEIFDRLLRKIAYLEENMPVRFDEIWLFGSFMRQEHEIGDLDIALLYDFTRDMSSREVMDFIDAHKAPSDLGYDPIFRRLLEIDQEPLLDGVTFDSLDLRTVSAPCCRLERCGETWARGHVLDRHPDAFFEKPLSREDVIISCDQGRYGFKGRLEPACRPCEDAPGF